MTAEPKLPPQPDIDTDLRDFWCYSSEQAHTYGLQCFEAGRQQGMAQERALARLSASTEEIALAMQEPPLPEPPKA